MKTLHKQTFQSTVDRGDGLYENMELRGIAFERCAISMTAAIERRSLVRNVQLIDCMASAGCVVGCAVVDSCVIDGLRTGALIQCWGTVFRHTVISGRIGRVMVSPRLVPSVATSRQQQAARDANRIFYADGDWALDISKAEFEEADLRGVPARLIVRDPETQVVVEREAAMRGAWRSVDLIDPLLPRMVQMFLDSGRDAEVFIAARRSRAFKQTNEGLRRLVDLGVATR